MTFVGIFIFIQLLGFIVHHGLSYAFIAFNQDLASPSFTPQAMGMIRNENTSVPKHPYWLCQFVNWHFLWVLGWSRCERVDVERHPCMPVQPNWRPTSNHKSTCSLLWQTIRPDLARWIYESRSVGGGFNLDPYYPMIIPWLSHFRIPIVGTFHVGQCSLYAGVKGGQAVLITHGVYVTYPRCTGNT